MTASIEYSTIQGMQPQKVQAIYDPGIPHAFGFLTRSGVREGFLLNLAHMLTSEGLLANGATQLAALTGGEEFTTTGLDTDTYEIIPAADTPRPVILVVTVVETFADEQGSQPVVTIGEDDGDTPALEKFVDASVLVDGVAGTIFTFGGTISAGAALVVDVTEATSDATGGVQVVAVVVPDIDGEFGVQG